MRKKWITSWCGHSPNFILVKFKPVLFYGEFSHSQSCYPEQCSQNGVNTLTDSGPHSRMKLQHASPFADHTVSRSEVLNVESRLYF